MHDLDHPHSHLTPLPINHRKDLTLGNLFFPFAAVL